MRCSFPFKFLRIVMRQSAARQRELKIGVSLSVAYRFRFRVISLIALAEETALSHVDSAPCAFA
jgi:hypothetical protein